MLSLGLSVSSEVLPIWYGNDLKYKGKRKIHKIQVPSLEKGWPLPRARDVPLAGEGWGSGLLEWSAFYPSHYSSPLCTLPPQSCFHALPVLLVLCFLPFAHAHLFARKRPCWFCVHSTWDGCIPPLPACIPCCVRDTDFRPCWSSSSIILHHDSRRTASFVISPGTALTACLGVELWASVWPPR